MRLMGNMGFISWEFMTGELLNINWKKKMESLRITGDNSMEYTCEKVCYALNKSLGWWWRAARKNPKVSLNMAGRWICPRHGHLSGLYWDSYLLLIIIPGFGRSEVVIIYRYLYMGKTWNWMGDFPVSHVWLRKGKQHKNGNIRIICREYSGLSKKGAKKVFFEWGIYQGKPWF